MKGTKQSTVVSIACGYNFPVLKKVPWLYIGKFIAKFNFFTGNEAGIQTPSEKIRH
jgi:hypothetical protein